MFKKSSSDDIEARRLATSLTASRRGRTFSEKKKTLKISFHLSNNLREIDVVVKISFLIEYADGNSINVEIIAPNATNKCNHRTDANDGRVHKRLYSVSIPTINRFYCSNIFFVQMFSFTMIRYRKTNTKN
jgi:hypothetical protein